MRGNQGQKLWPGNDQVHRVQEFTLALGDKLKYGGGEPDLFHLKLSIGILTCVTFANHP